MTLKRHHRSNLIIALSLPIGLSLCVPFHAAAHDLAHDRTHDRAPQYSVAAITAADMDAQITRLRDRDPAIRLDAIEILGGMALAGHNPAQIMSAISSLMRVPEAAIRAAAVRHVAAIGAAGGSANRNQAAALRALAAQSSDNVESIRLDAIIGIGTIGRLHNASATQALRDLEDAFNHRLNRGTTLRTTALTQIGIIGSAHSYAPASAALRVLSGAVDDTDNDARAAAINGIVAVTVRHPSLLNAATTALSRATDPAAQEALARLRAPSAAPAP